jgi:O-methyltransferase
VTGLTFDMEPEFLALYERCRTETMTSIERMHALWSALRYVVHNRIDGDIVECGVWRGGSMMLSALTLGAAEGARRRLWLYDTFAGMSEPSDADVQAMSGLRARDVLAEAPRTEADPFWAIAPRATVESNMRATGYPADAVVYIEGPVEETLPAEAPDQIALLRLDTDWYESTKHELTCLWPRLAGGGVLIVDDYGYWRGARRAVDEYFSGAPILPLLARVDFTGRIAVKPFAGGVRLHAERRS